MRLRIWLDRVLAFFKRCQIIFVPFSFGGGAWLTIEGRPDLPMAARVAYFRMVSPDYLRTLGVPLLKGRWFKEDDGPDRPPVVIVNRRAAELFGRDALGGRLKLGDPSAPWMTVVGVAGDIREEGLDRPSKGPTVYFPYTQMKRVSFFNPRDLAIRASGDPTRLVAAVQKQVWAVDRDQSISLVRTMDDIVQGQLSQRRTQTLLLGSFSTLALLLAALGMYALLSFVVAERTQEFGIRMALGARRWDVVGAVLRRSFTSVGGGAAAGILVSLAVTRTLSTLLYGVSPTDPATLCGVVVLLMGVGILASCLPAMRATKIDPTSALKYD